MGYSLGAEHVKQFDFFFTTGRICRVVHKGGEHEFGMADMWVRLNWYDIQAFNTYICTCVLWS